MLKEAVDFIKGLDNVNLAVYVRRVVEEKLMYVVYAWLKAIGLLAMGCLDFI